MNGVFVGMCLALQLSPKALVVNTSLSCTMLGWYIFFHISMMLIHLVLDNRKPKHIHTFIVIAVVKHYIYFHNYQVPEGKQMSSINTQQLKLKLWKTLSKITNYLYFKDSILLKCFFPLSLPVNFFPLSLNKCQSIHQTEETNT